MMSFSSTNNNNNNTNKSVYSPKKILIQKYNEDLNVMMIRRYSSRLILTWVFKNPLPPTLDPIPNINITTMSPLSLPIFVQQGTDQLLYNNNLNNSSLYFNKTLSPQTTPFSEIYSYINRLVDIVSDVIHFFYSQNCKRHNELIQQQFDNNPNHIYHKKKLLQQQQQSQQSQQQQQKQLEEQNKINNNTDYISIFVGCIFYADLFLKKNQKQSISIIDVIITSITITIKMWIEEKMSVNKYMSKIFGVPLAHINKQEIHFLKSIDYQIFLNEDDIKSFANIIQKSHDNSNNNNSNSNNNPIINITPSSSNNNIKTCINENTDNSLTSASVPSASNTPVLSTGSSTSSTSSSCIIISPDIRSSSSSPSIATSQPSSCLTTPTIIIYNNSCNPTTTASGTAAAAATSCSASFSPSSIVPSSPNTPQQIRYNKRKPLFQHVSTTKETSLQNTTTLVLCSTKHTPSSSLQVPPKFNINRTSSIKNSSPTKYNSINDSSHIIKKNHIVHNNTNNNSHNNENIITSNEEDNDYDFDIIEEPRKRIKEIVSF